MEHSRYLKFLAAVQPVLERLAGEWFPPNKKTPDGQSYYACTYCTLNFSAHDKHDEDCYAEMAKGVLAEFKAIEEDPRYLFSPVTGEPRTLEEIKQFHTWNKGRAVLRDFYGKDLTSLIPMDYTAPENHNVICTCRIFSDGEEFQRSHAPECIIQLLAKALVELFTVASN
jgi:hypothetical protein